MKVIALIAQKGGTGKTTLAISLAVAAEKMGSSTVVVDLDPQATACNWSDRRTEKVPIVIDAQPARLPQALQKASEAGLKLALIDTPARSEQAALAAAKVADLVLVPCRPQVYDIETIPNTIDILALAGNKPGMVVFNAIPHQGNRHEQASRAAQDLGINVCPATVGQRAAFGDAAALGLSVQDYEANGKAALEIRHVYKYVMRQLK